MSAIIGRSVHIVPALSPSLQSFASIPDPATLYSDLSSRYDVIEEQIHLDSYPIRMLRVKDTNALVEEIHSSTFRGDERLPYWAEVWPSSIELARHCLEDIDLHGRTVLDLGCGLGLAGIAAAIAGGRVIFADYEPDALLFARYNAMKNLPPAIMDSHVEFRLLDWRSVDEDLEPVDMIVGADVVYERRNFLPIIHFVRRTLKRNGTAVFTDPDRTTGMAFFAFAEREGFDVSLRSRRLNHANRERHILFGELRCESEVG